MCTLACSCPPWGFDQLFGFINYYGLRIFFCVFYFGCVLAKNIFCSLFLVNAVFLGPLAGWQVLHHFWIECLKIFTNFWLADLVVITPFLNLMVEIFHFWVYFLQSEIVRVINITCGLVLHHCRTVSEMSRTFRNSISLADSSFLQFSSFRPQSTSSSLFSFQTHLTIMVVSPLKKPSQTPIPTPSEALQRTFQINCSLLQCRKTSLSSQLSLLSQLSPSFIKVFIFQDGKAALPQTRVSYSGSKQYHSSMDRWNCCNNL